MTYRAQIELEFEFESANITTAKKEYQEFVSLLVEDMGAHILVVGGGIEELPEDVRPETEGS